VDLLQLIGGGGVSVGTSFLIIKYFLSLHEKKIELIEEKIKTLHDSAVKLEVKLDVVEDNLSKQGYDISRFLDKFTEPFFKFSSNLETVVRDVAEIKEGLKNAVMKDDCERLHRRRIDD